MIEGLDDDAVVKILKTHDHLRDDIEIAADSFRLLFADACAPHGRRRPDETGPAAAADPQAAAGEWIAVSGGGPLRREACCSAATYPENAMQGKMLIYLASPYSHPDPAVREARSI